MDLGLLACYGGRLAVVEYTFDVLGGAALRVTPTNGETPVLLLERLERTNNASATLGQLRRLLAIPGE